MCNFTSIFAYQLLLIAAFCKGNQIDSFNTRGDIYNGPYLIANLDMFGSGWGFQKNWVAGAMTIPSAAARAEVLQLLNDRESIASQIVNIEMMTASCQNSSQLNNLTIQHNAMTHYLESINRKLANAAHTVLTGSSGMQSSVSNPPHQSPAHFGVLLSSGSSNVPARHPSTLFEAPPYPGRYGAVPNARSATDIPTVHQRSTSAYSGSHLEASARIPSQDPQRPAPSSILAATVG